MKKVWNIPLIWKLFKIGCLIGFILLFFNSCDENSVLPNQPEMTLMSSESPPTINPG